MILEVAVLNIKKGFSKDFENSFKEAQKIISSMKGYVSHELKKSIEQEDKYLLLVNWETLKTMKKDFVNQKHIRNGKNYCTIITNHFQL